VMYGGTADRVAFSGQVGTATTTPSAIELPWRQSTGSTPVTFQSTATIEALTAEAYGLSQVQEFTDAGVQDNPDRIDTSTIRHEFDIVHGGMLQVEVNSVGNDVDLYLLYDANHDGLFDFGSEVVATSAGATGHEYVQIALPPDGRYMAAVHGYDVTAGEPVTTTIAAAQGFDLTVSDLARHDDGSFTFNVNWNKVIPYGESFRGIVWLGPTDAPALVAVPVSVTAPELHEVKVPVAADTYLDGWRPTVNTDTGAPSYHPLRLRQGGVYEPLLKFDLAGIPANATVESAAMNLYCYGTGNFGMGAEVYKLLRGWNETQTTWLRASTSEFWGSPGAHDTTTDRAAAPSATAALTPASKDTFVTFGVKDLAQAWVTEPTANMGVLLMGVGPVSTEYSFRSSHDSHTTDHPFMVVKYVIENP
jgi:hypothetical protein